jgi:hypothetical protein
MANEDKGIRMAAATKEDVKKLYTLYNVIENFKKYDARSMDEFEHFEAEEKRWLEKIFVDDSFDDDQVVDANELINYISGLLHGFHRVVMGYEVLFDNCANKDLDYLDFNDDIKESTELWNEVEKQLKEKGIATINKSDDWGKKILSQSEPEEAEKGVQKS